MQLHKINRHLIIHAPQLLNLQRLQLQTRLQHMYQNLDVPQHHLGPHTLQQGHVEFVPERSPLIRQPCEVLDVGDDDLFDFLGRTELRLMRLWVVGTAEFLQVWEGD
ncbi:hypothetical protein BGZ47_010737 [Haplosporangium gracile]|nr:hypothetical protein BGZ47_010737 [Haplosporangium gracile]